jgi:hypothetical protein
MNPIHTLPSLGSTLILFSHVFLSLPESLSFSGWRNIYLRVLQNRVPRRIFGSKREKVARGGGNCVMRGFIICSLHRKILQSLHLL